MRSLLVDPAALEARRAETARRPALAALAAHLARQVDEVLAHPLYVPEAKALLSRWGAHCRDDGAELEFDPYSPHRQRCSHCGRHWETEQSHRWWIYWYQLWLAERVWLLALHAGPGGRGDAEARAIEALAALAARYGGYPNADNVLGPSRPFFSTYLESIWALHLAAAASLLREMDRLPAELARDLQERLFRPSVYIIADFDEGRSNRQVWNAAAVFALARVLGDDATAHVAAHGPGGIIPTLEAGLLDDGLWYEGENYHWFALRGLGWGAEMLRLAEDVDLWEDEGAAGRRFREAFRAPLLTALPDFTGPARRDAKFGVSLRQRRMAEMWEWAHRMSQAYGRSDAAAEGRAGAEFYASLLSHVYDPAVPANRPAGSEITEVERAEPPSGVRREELGWKGWLWMSPELEPAGPGAWRPGSVHLEATGVAIFRRDEGRSYVGLDYGEGGGGHGHPDRLNLTLVWREVPWLLDFGTGSYVAPSLAWYRTTLAHNAPLVDGQSQAPARGICVAHQELGDYAWVCAQLPLGAAYHGALLQRTLVLAPGYLLDVVQLLSESGERGLAVPWHGLGELTLDESGFAFHRDGEVLPIRLSGRQPFQVAVRSAPGPPGPELKTAELAFAVVAAGGEEVTLAACLDLGAGVEEVECVEDTYVVRLSGDRIHVHRPSDAGWQIERERGDPVELKGLREESGVRSQESEGVGSQVSEGVGDQGSGSFRMAVPGERFVIGGPPAFGASAPVAPVAASCRRVERSPALDGTLSGFDAASPLRLDREDQFRRAEEPWGGAGSFSAQAFLNHDGEAIYLGVEVVAPEPAFRPGGAPNPEWENENPDIHSDGLQLYLETPTGFFGWLAVPDLDDTRRVRVAAVRGSDAEVEMVTRGAWQLTPSGYRVTLALDVPDALEGEFGFDLYVNRARAGRERRVGQLVWSGARGARLYLGGDRPLPGPLPRVRAE